MNAHVPTHNMIYACSIHWYVSFNIEKIDRDREDKQKSMTMSHRWQLAILLIDNINLSEASTNWVYSTDRMIHSVVAYVRMFKY
jgi:hypothetical protein